ncbi:MAG: hypothetical protein GF416_06495 [Candidatus Altiarchaeales archaeon]|nr:hypothetical protein [Candidatus Altiarchaeales archaeon]MBD3416764.1 hypothetical protein [Candidatus Altiarchaeales archaeon]
MSKRLSELYGMDIYTTKAQYIGEVKDVILNLDKGEVMQLCLSSLRGGEVMGEDVRRIIQEESISYDEVAEVGDIVLVQKAPPVQKK